MKTHWVFSMYKDHMYPREFVNVAEAAASDNNQIVWHNRDIVISFNFSLYVYIIRNCGILNSMAPSYRDLRKVFSSFSNSWNKCVITWRVMSTWCDIDKVCVGATSFQEYFYLIIECFYLGFFLLSLHILD